MPTPTGPPVNNAEYVELLNVCVAVKVCASPSDARPVAQVNPDPLVQFRSLPVALQLGMANAVGLPVLPVALARTVFAA